MEILVTLLISRFLHPFLTNGGESQDSQGFQNNLLERKCEIFYSLYGSTYFGWRYIEEQGSLTQHGLTLFFLCLVVVMLGPLIKISFIFLQLSELVRSSSNVTIDHGVEIAIGGKKYLNGDHGSAWGTQDLQRDGR